MTVGGAHYGHGGVMNGNAGVVSMGNPHQMQMQSQPPPYGSVMRSSNGGQIANGVQGASVQPQGAGQQQYVMMNGQLMLVQTQPQTQSQQISSYQTGAPTSSAQSNVDLHQVYKSVWIGAYSALNSNILVQRGIRFVCNTARELKENGAVYGVDWRTLDQTGITVKHTSWDDNAQEQIWPFSSTTLDALTFIENAVQKGHNILVNCLMGRSRSTSLVLAFMIYSEGFTLDKTLDTVRTNRGVASPNLSFLSQLRQLEAAMQTAPHRPLKQNSPTAAAAAAALQPLNSQYALVPASASPPGSFSKASSGLNGSMNGMPPQQGGQMMVQASQLQQYVQQLPPQQAAHVQQNGNAGVPQPVPAQSAQAGMLVLYDEKQAQVAMSQQPPPPPQAQHTQQHIQQVQQAQSQQNQHMQQMQIQALQNGQLVFVPAQNYGVQDSARSQGGIDSARYAPWGHQGQPQGGPHNPAPRVGGGGGQTLPGPQGSQYAPPAVPVPLPNPVMGNHNQAVAPPPPPHPGMAGSARRPRQMEENGPAIRMAEAPVSARTPHVGTSLLGPSLPAPEYERGGYSMNGMMMQGGGHPQQAARYVPLNDGYGGAPMYTGRASHPGPGTADRSGWNGQQGRRGMMPLAEPHYTNAPARGRVGGYPVGNQGYPVMGARARGNSSGGLPRTTSAPDLPAASARMPMDESMRMGQRFVPLMGDGRLYRSHTPGRKQVDPRMFDAWH